MRPSLCSEYLRLHIQLHQILPPILSVLLHSSLPPSNSTHLRTTASETLSTLLTQHSTTYPSLSPRIMKTLLLALISPGKSHGTREGAIRGLVGVGKEAVRKGLVEGGGAKVVAAESEGDMGHGVNSYGLVNSVLVRTFSALYVHTSNISTGSPARASPSIRHGGISGSIQAR